MTELCRRAAPPGANPPSLSIRHRTRILLALLVASLGTVVVPGTAEAAQPRKPQAAAPRHAPTRALPRQVEQRRVPQGRPSRTAASVAPGPGVLSALQTAEARTGADPKLLLAIAARESGFDPAAQNRRSSARGLMQFTRATWIEVVRDFGGRHGLVEEAAALAATPRGSEPANPRLVTQVLRLRDDPRLAAAMAAERLESGRGPLERALGRPATSADLYLVHLLGPTGARRFLLELSRNPQQPASVVAGAAVGPNRSVFARGGRALSLADVYREVGESLESGPSQPSLVRTAGFQLADAQ